MGPPEPVPPIIVVVWTGVSAPAVFIITAPRPTATSRDDRASPHRPPPSRRPAPSPPLDPSISRLCSIEFSLATFRPGPGDSPPTHTRRRGAATRPCYPCPLSENAHECRRHAAPMPPPRRANAAPTPTPRQRHSRAPRRSNRSAVPHLRRPTLRCLVYVGCEFCTCRLVHHHAPPSGPSRPRDPAPRRLGPDVSGIDHALFPASASPGPRRKTARIPLPGRELPANLALPRPAWPRPRAPGSKCMDIGRFARYRAFHAGAAGGRFAQPSARVGASVQGRRTKVDQSPRRQRRSTTSPTRR